MMWAGAFYHFLSGLFEPLPLLLLTLAAALAWVCRQAGWPRRTTACVATLVLLLWAACTPIVAGWARSTLRVSRGPAPTSCDAVVVLGGGMRPATEAPDDIELADDSVIRCLTAIQVCQTLPKCPVFVSGGVVVPIGYRTLGGEMEKFLRAFGLADAEIVAESTSRTTHENAVETAKLLKARGLRRITLVTHELHMRRAMACFRAQGLEVIPVSCREQGRGGPWTARVFLPASTALHQLTEVWHEWLGIAWYFMKGRLG